MASFRRSISTSRPSANRIPCLAIRLLVRVQEILGVEKLDYDGMKRRSRHGVDALRLGRLGDTEA